MGVSVTRIVKFIRKGEKGSGLITAVTYLRKYTLSQWKNYGAVGKQNNWIDISNASDMNVGDTIVINGVVTDKENISISLYATIIAITGTTVIANSTTLIMAGERGIQGIQGLQGLQGPRGEQGLPGTGGKNGATSYFHIKYSAVANPTVSSQMSETPNTYIGTYVDFTKADSTDPKKYTWHRFEGLQGPRGEQGIPGVGTDGKTTYLHIKYSNNGGKTFTANNGETVGDYIGFCTDFNATDPTSVSSYTWSKIKGEPGKDGVKGDRGPALRGPQAWSDCAIGYVFQSGASGEEYKDVVLYGNNYYSCIKSHTKTASNYPGSATDTNSGLWKLADKLEIVATKILLAQYALVKNLGVEAIDMKDANGKIVFQAINGKVTCNSGTFNSVKVTGDSEFSGTMKAVSGSFKSLNCVNDKGEVVGNITFGSDGRMWFDGDMYSQGYRSDKKRSNRFYTSDVFCRGMFGHFGKTMAVVKGTYMYVYSKGADQSGVYVSLKTGKTSNNKTFYYIPLYSPSNTDDLSGMPIDVVVFNTTSDYYYAFSSMGNGKEWRVINGNDRQTVHFCDIGGWHELSGGASVNCVYVNPEWLNPVPNKNDIARGVFWTGEKDLNW